MIVSISLAGDQEIERLKESADAINSMAEILIVKCGNELIGNLQDIFTGIKSKTLLSLDSHPENLENLNLINDHVRGDPVVDFPLPVAPVTSKSPR